MAFAVPAIRATMGSRIYFIGKMSAGQLAGQIGIASELDDWSTRTLEDVYQRDLSDKRVMQTIAPYLANNADRFFGSIIVWARDPDMITFESLSEIAAQLELPSAYREALTDVGVVTVDGSKDTRAGLVALDGQHRLAALRANVQGKVVGPYADRVIDDELTVIFINDEDRIRTRGLFTILNRTARRVSKNDVLIMSETEGAAIAARRLAADVLLAPRGLDDRPLVKWTSNTIANRDTEITTLNALVDVAATIGSFHDIALVDDDDAQVEPPEANVAQVSEILREWLTIFFEELSVFEDMRHNAQLVVDGRQPDRQFSMLLRPIGFISFFRAVALAMRRDCGNVPDLRTAMSRLARLDWCQQAALWRSVLVDSRGRMSRRDADIDLAAELAVWMISGTTSGEQFRASLLDRYRRQVGNKDASLPAPLGR